MSTRDAIIRKLAVAEAGGNYELAARLRAQLLDAELTAREQVVYENVAAALVELRRQPGPAGAQGQPGPQGPQGSQGPRGLAADPLVRYTPMDASALSAYLNAPHPNGFASWYPDEQGLPVVHICGRPCLSLSGPGLTVRSIIDLLHRQDPRYTDEQLAIALQGADAFGNVVLALRGYAFIDHYAGDQPVYDYIGA